MAVTSSGTDAFLELLSKSQVIDEARLQAWVTNAGGSGGLPADAKDTADMLIREGLLTPFQAELLLAGKWRHFVVNGKYRVLSLLGTGGMGSVYLCEHLRMARRVALKVLPPQFSNDADAQQRFLREAQALSSLDHPNIVRAYDFDQDGKMYFLAMEYVEGVTLNSLVETSGPMTSEQAVNYLYQAAAGLDHASQAGWIHRDIKPRNLLIDRSGTLKILDLGLAKLIHHVSSLTDKHDPGAVIGTLDFLSPEQADPSLPLDVRSDIYSLGATFYYALTGSVLFPDATMTQKLIFHRLREPRPLMQLRPELPPGLVAVIEQMLAKAPENRYQTPAEIMEDLRPLQMTASHPQHSQLAQMVDQAQALRNQASPTGNTAVFPDLLDGDAPDKTRKWGQGRQPRIFLAASLAGLVSLALVGYLATRSPSSKPTSVAAVPSSQSSKTAPMRPPSERLTQLKFGPWYLIGPFDNPNGKGFDRVYPPEQEIELKKQYPGKNNETASWQQKPFVDGKINDLRVFREENNTDSVAYVYREIECPEAMDLPIGLGSDDTLTVWLNGKKLLSEGIPRPVIPDQNKLTLNLQKGKNHLLMKICQADGGWAFYFAVK